MIRINVEHRYSCGSWQSLLVVTSLFVAAEMRRQMTEARVRVRTRLRPFVAEFLSDIQLSLRFNSLSNTEANASVSELLSVLLPLKSTDSRGNVAELLCTVKKVGRIATPRFFFSRERLLSPSCLSTIFRKSHRIHV